jgi:hypothetical protein
MLDLANARKTTPPWQTVVHLRHALGWFFGSCALVHIGIAGTDAQAYRHFADDALFSFVESAWRDIFMADPAGWALVVAETEALLGAALLMGGVWARIGYAGVLAFHVALMTFGWGFWLWSVPAIVGVGLLALHDDVFHPTDRTRTPTRTASTPGRVPQRKK